MAGVTEADTLRTRDILMDHVILSRVLPEEKSRYIYEQMLMIKMVENVENLSDWLPAKTVEMFQRLKRVHLECTKSDIAEEINDLEAGKLYSN